MQTGSVEEISKMADNHWRDLVKELEANPRYVPVSEKLAVLEAQQGNFDFVGFIVQLVPNAAISIINGGFAAYKKHAEAKELAGYRNELATIMGNALYKQNKSMPSFDTMCLKQAMAYQLFLNNFSTNDLTKDGPLCRALTDLKGKTNLKLQSVEFTEFENIRKQQQEFHAAINKVNQAMRDGKEQFQKEFGNIEVSTKNNHDEIINKLQDLGVKVTDKLRDILNNSQEVRQHVTNMHHYFMTQAARQAREDAEQQKQANFQGLAATCGFLGELGKYVGSKELQQVATVGAACVKIAQAATAIQGLTSLSLAALNPIMAIGMGALAIFSAFGKQGLDRTPLILDAIRSVALQLHTLGKQLHARLDYVDEMLRKILKNLILGFCELRFENSQIKIVLKQILGEMRESHSHIQGVIHTMSSRIETIADNQLRIGRREKIEAINKLLNRVFSDFKLDEEVFKSSFQDLTEEVKDTQLTNPLLVGESTDHDPAALHKRLESDSHSHFFAEFNVALINRHVSKMCDIPYKDLVNPALWIWQTLGLMHLVQRCYPDNASTESCISETEFAKLQIILNLGEDLQKYILQWQNKDLLVKLKEDCLKAGEVLQKELESIIREEEEKNTAKLNSNWKNKIDITNAGIVEAFRQSFEITENPEGKKWFHAYLAKGLDINYSWLDRFSGKIRKHFEDRYFQSIPKPKEEKFVQEAIAAYRQERQKTIADFKMHYVEKIRLPLNEAMTLESQGGRPLRVCQYKFYSEPMASDFFHLNFIFPENNEQPVLPMAPGYRPYIPAKFYQAEWLGVGQLIARYRITQNQFILTTHLDMADQSVQVGSESVCPYVPGIYQGSEAIWNFWTGGKLSKAGNTIDTKASHQGNMWEHVLIPECEEVKGLRDTLVYRPDPYEVKAIDLVAAKVFEKQQQLKTEMHEKLIGILQNNEQHSFTKAMIRFSNCYYMLRGVLALAFHDNVPIFFNPDMEGFSNLAKEVKNDGEKNNSPAIPFLRNRKDFVAVLGGSLQSAMPISACFTHNVAYIRQTVSKEIDSLFMAKSSNDLCHDLLTDILKQFRSVVAKYQLTKVRHNHRTETLNDPAGNRKKHNAFKARLFSDVMSEEEFEAFQKWKANSRQSGFQPRSDSPIGAKPEAKKDNGERPKSAPNRPDRQGMRI